MLTRYVQNVTVVMLDDEAILVRGSRALVTLIGRTEHLFSEKRCDDKAYLNTLSPSDMAQRCPRETSCAPAPIRLV